MKRARIIYNPTSGREAIRRDLVDILNVYEKAGYETSAFATTAEPNSALNEARRAAEAGFELLVAAGGDGTINEVVNGIAPLEKRPMLAIIPAGTTNDYARALRIPREDPLEAAKVILKGKAAQMDVGQANDTYFINIAAGGSLSELTYSVPSKLKSMYGYLAYVVKGAEMLTRVAPMNLRVEYDNGVFEGRSSMFFLALTNSVGGFEQIVPDAQLDDGKFTLLVVKTTKFAEILQLISEVLTGKHVDNPNLLYVKSENVTIKPLDENAKVMINLDGEYGGDAPVVFKDHKAHIAMVANVDEMPDNSLIDLPLYLHED
ncbi:diacylglycerol kinase [Weissella sp. GP1]|jgi:diacylglycerol kinase (ATP)|uniref:Diacylglycerol kinase n=1 Tax=Weissella fermenti TaxID=2987699 RepID=A0ABT6D3D1_9LACO|nr:MULTISPECIES: diacylglycerol kinase [Weissella]MBJ7687443.1 diacylglycerol kinase [Weissella confusa]MBJ7694483.1 diacylglycerol kinase [Weissella confusa]MCW0927566.1 diacylglycerol kinase [Weissella sp. LMG 11983]MDF9300021.1 diacylglycerol kinase [Weissella sp. BK2]QBZ05083.1 diacylglycerol kinase [Weissella confusa]